ncbi:MAG: FAD binding domain-containing protein [Nannocystaceae bacterium]|nr:FAD binding domain-containing protein [Nannocystaceae bacterium]
MRADLSRFEVVRPRALDEVLVRLGEGGWSVLAGGTDLMVTLGALALPPGRYVDVWRVDALRGITVTDDAITMGALTTYADVQRHPLLQVEFPMLVEAARRSGAAAIQNRGTLGGNIANASPAADSPPALLAYGAVLELHSRAGTRRLAYADFHTGYKQTLRRGDELIARVILPRRAAAAAPVAGGVRDGVVDAYRKIGTRKAQAIAKVGLAVRLELQGGVVADAAIGAASVAPVPLFARTTAAALRGRPLADAIEAAVAAFGDEVTPIDDVRSSARYRRQVAVNVLRDVLAAVSAGRTPVDSL